ncbi:MAG TPA: hypothetical protein VHD36_09700 [Pirellulales bacterium]|nr:hypothetical protein [Pirellulales bacterium]
MAFSLTQFASTRPYLYHLTSARNADQVVQARTIHTARHLFESAKAPAWIDQKRTATLSLSVDGALIDIRDQQPLYEGKTSLQDGWTFARLIRELNSRIFFWPGWDHGVIAYGMRHFERYQSEKPAILRVRTEDLFAINHKIVPEFCKYNSGSPRTTQGKGSPRGRATFLKPEHASFPPSAVIEVTYSESVQLPQTVERSSRPDGRWNKV